MALDGNFLGGFARGQNLSRVQERGDASQLLDEEQFIAGQERDIATQAQAAIGDTLKIISQTVEQAKAAGASPEKIQKLIAGMRQDVIEISQGTGQDPTRFMNGIDAAIASPVAREPTPQQEITQKLENEVFEKSERARLGLDSDSSDIPERMGFSKEATGRFNAAISAGATEQEAIAEAVSTSSERTSNVEVDQALKSLNLGLERFEKFIVGDKDTEGEGAVINPVSGAAQTVQTMRRGIQLQLKELFDLGVLNGPDLALMNEILFDPQLSLNPIGDEGVNIPINPVERTKASVAEIRNIISDITSGRRLPSQFGKRRAGESKNKTISKGEALADIRGTTQSGIQFRIKR